MDIGPFLKKAGKKARHDPVCKRGHGRDPQHARILTANLVGETPDAIEPDIGPLDLLQQRHGRLRRDQLVSATVEELEFRVDLKIADQAAHGGLSDRHQFRCSRHFSSQHDGSERFDLTQVHVSP